MNISRNITSALGVIVLMVAVALSLQSSFNKHTSDYKLVQEQNMIEKGSREDQRIQEILEENQELRKELSNH